MDIFEGLNLAQIDAVKSVDGPLLILAGAGSGKTKTLTHRIAHLIQNHGVAPDEILALTFTNKAAKEMRERLAKLLNRQNNWHFMPWMGTFHSICVRILRKSGGEIGIDANFVIYDESDRKNLVRQIVKDMHLSDKQIKPQTVVAVISSSKNKMISSAEFIDNAKGENQKIFGQIYQKYESALKKAKALDFDDLLLEVVRLLKTRSEAREFWQNQFKYILIDEYQDTNQAQYHIVKYLVNSNENICVVGDDWQSIYSWRGADFTNILNFKKDFPLAKEVKLEQNYRSTGNILNSAQRLIEKNTLRTDKKLWTELEDGKEVGIIPVRDEIDEAERVVEIIKQSLVEGRKLSDVAVLYRTNAQSYHLERSLTRAKISHKIIGGVRFFDRKEIKDVIAYLRLAYQPSDVASFMRIVNLPARGIGKVSVDKYLAFVNQNNYDFVSGLEHLKESDLSNQVKTKFEIFEKVIVGVKSRYDRGSLPKEIIEEILQLTRYRDFINDRTPEAEDRLANLNVLLNEASLYGDLASFLEDASLMSSADQTAGKDQVSLMTMHSAKGLEFPVVAIVGMEDGICPHARVFETPSELEEERRLCYVAMTRAREELYMLYASTRTVFGERRYCLPSQFLAEIGGNLEITEDEIFVDEPIFNEFEVGERVNSRQFGDGEIIDVDGLAVSVRFDDGKMRKLNIQYANLVKL